MAATPNSSSENAIVNPAHHKVEGGRSIGRHTSSVTVPGFLWPAMSGIRSGEQTSAIPLILLSDDLEIVHRRPHVQLLEHPILASILRQARDAALRVVQIAEDDRACRAALLAGRASVAVLNGSAVVLRIDLGFLDALHAEGTLLHYSTRAHRDIGV